MQDPPLHPADVFVYQVPPVSATVEAFCCTRTGVADALDDGGGVLLGEEDGEVVVEVGVVDGAVTSNASTQTQSPPEAASLLPVAAIVKVWLALVRPFTE